MDLRALNRLSLITGILILLGTIVAIREMHTEERGIELLLIAGLAVGAFLTIVGLVNVLLEPPTTAEEEEDERAEETLRTDRPVSITTAIGAYILVLAVVSGIIVGIATGDAGFGIQTFTFGLILGGVIWGLGVLLGHRPVEEES